MPYASDQLQSLDPTLPADSEQEAQMPDRVRTLTAALLAWADIEHYRTGKHKRFFGVDVGAANAYKVVIPHILLSLDTGLELTFIPLVNNTGACTLEIITANNISLGIVSIKKIASNPASGDIIANAPIQVIYNGTNFILVNGNGAINITTSPGGVHLISAQDTGFAEVSNTTSPTIMGSLSAPSNIYTFLIFECELLIRNNSGSNQNYNFVINQNGLPIGADLTIRESGGGTAVATDYISLKRVISGGSPTAFNVTVTMGAANPNVACQLRGVHIYGTD